MITLIAGSQQCGSDTHPTHNSALLSQCSEAHIAHCSASHWGLFTILEFLAASVSLAKCRRGFFSLCWNIQPTYAYHYVFIPRLPLCCVQEKQQFFIQNFFFLQIALFSSLHFPGLGIWLVPVFWVMSSSKTSRYNRYSGGAAAPAAAPVVTPSTPPADSCSTVRYIYLYIPVSKVIIYWECLCASFQSRMEASFGPTFSTVTAGAKGDAHIAFSFFFLDLLLLAWLLSTLYCFWF